MKANSPTDTLDEVFINFKNTSFSKPEMDYIKTHINRVRRTLAVARKYIRIGCEVLNIGLSPFDLIGQQIFGREHYSVLVPSSAYLQSFDENFIRSFRIVFYNIASDAAPPPQQYDLVICAEVLEHIFADDEEVMTRLARLLRPGGYLLVSVPNAARHVNRFKLLLGRNIYMSKREIIRGVFGGYGHVREYTQQELEDLVSSRFKIVELFGINEFGSRFSRTLLRILPSGMSSTLVCIGMVGNSA